jgi:hypothetical protein
MHPGESLLVVVDVFCVWAGASRDRHAHVAVATVVTPGACGATVGDGQIRSTSVTLQIYFLGFHRALFYSGVLQGVTMDFLKYC